ncbi:MAG: DUF4270 domain-containing protein [Bacteroidales bacterium]|nr:DUF4270 domain-containing protein [Bacteroidales bacterium]
MKKTSRFLKSTLALLIVGILSFSCIKEPSQIGLDIVGSNPLNVLFSDTTSVRVYSVLRDSVRTDYLANNLLGVVVDPVFGTTKASLYIQYDLSLANYSFGEQESFDSLVLSIPYQMISVYGDSTAPLSFNVYELNEQLILDTAYYSNQTASFLPELLGSATILPKPFESVLIDTVHVEPHFTMRLSDELGRRLLAMDDTIYYNNDDFIDRFKGLYFEPVFSGGTGNLTYLNMRGARSKLTIHYKNSVSDSLSYSFAVSANSPSFQNYDHLDYVGSDPDFYRQVIEKDSTLGEQKFYLQTLGGVDSYISFPSLFKRNDIEKYAINEAKLIITNIDPNNIFVQPANMVLFQKRYSELDSISSYYYIEDSGGGEAYFDGYYNSASKQYEFRITNYIQDYISGKFDSDKLLMQISSATYKGARLIGSGFDPSSNPESRIRLEIIYTEIETDNQ